MFGSFHNFYNYRIYQKKYFYEIYDETIYILFEDLFVSKCKPHNINTWQ